LAYPFVKGLSLTRWRATTAGSRARYPSRVTDSTDNDPAPREIRVSDAEREAVVARLNTATGEGRLTLEEFGERAGQAYAVRTTGELARLVDDLPVATGTPPVRVPATRERISQTIGPLKRSGRWRLDRDSELSTVLGAVKLDLRGAELVAPEVELAISTVLGSVKVWIPRGVRVEVGGATVVGTRQVEEGNVGGYPAPLLRLRIDTVLGSVKVYRV
jgi:DUF1707 SHOCT-like domain/Cell wall-active antibiotics response LiaF, C-terminal